jgi:hypothetical protein
VGKRRERKASRNTASAGCSRLALEITSVAI